MLKQIPLNPGIFAYKFLNRNESLVLLSSYFYRKLSEDPNSLSDYITEIMDGLGGAAFHGTILLGWSLHDSPRNTFLLAEGLAYAVAWWESFGDVSYEPNHQSGWKLMDIFQKIRSDNKFEQTFSGWHSKFPIYQQRVAELKQNFAAELLDYAKLWTPNDPAAAAEELIECVGKIFLCAGANDFFLLHGLTSGFAVAEIVNALGKSDRVILNLLWHFALAAIYMFIAEGSPDCTPVPFDNLMSWDEITSTISSETSRFHDAV
jgi:hypothetical protein